jgi:hypothetical protein
MDKPKIVSLFGADSTGIHEPDPIHEVATRLAQNEHTDAFGVCMLRIDGEVVNVGFAGAGNLSLLEAMALLDIAKDTLVRKLRGEV